MRTGGFEASLPRWADRPALGAVARVLQARLVAGIAQHHGTEPHRDARLVHHVEHAAQTFARRTDQVADRTRGAAHLELALTEVQQRVRNAAITQLVVQARERHVVALAGEFGAFVHQLLRHDEQRDAFGAGNQLAVRPRDLGQHQVHDVLGELVLAVADPHLVAAQAVARAERVALEVIAVGHGARGDVRQRRAGLRLAQAHGAEPAAGELVLREHLFLQRRAMGHQQVGVAAGEQPATADADARLGEEGIGGHLDHARQLHATVFVVLRRGQHAGLDVGPRRGVRARRQDHLLAVEARLLDIGHAVERREFFARDAFAGVEHRSEWSRASDRRNAADRAAPPRAASRARESRRCRASPDPSCRGLHHARDWPDRQGRCRTAAISNDFHAGLMRRPRARSCPAPPHRAFRPRRCARTRRNGTRSGSCRSTRLRRARSCVRQWPAARS